MKILIAGARTLTDERTYQRLAELLEKLRPTEIIHGGAAGADRLAGRYAQEKGLPETIVKPDYDRSGKYAPLVRNGEMVRMADLVVCCYAAGKVREGGTGDTYKKAKKAGKLAAELMPEGEPEQGALW
jgi:YspA, cpYpsA-related SLOG family